MGLQPDSPERNRVAADERRIGALLRAVEAPAPAALHQRIAAIGARRRARRRCAPSFALAGAFAGAAAIAVMLIVGAGTGPPTALRISQLALSGPTAPPRQSLVAAGTTIAFPKWSARGWLRVGTRSDRIDGRTVTTEFYRSYEAGTLGYAIVSGAPLRWGAGGRVAVQAGAVYRLISIGGAQIVAWVQAGHTCVLASRTASTATLLRLAVAPV